MQERCSADILGALEFEIFPDPVPKEVDGVIHHDEGEDEKGQYLP
jgi:hypothetical protein